MFYLQDSRSYVGNNMLWWAAAGGYTTDLSKARVYSEVGAQAKHFERTSDIPWPTEYIDSKVRPAVDMQYVKLKEALKGTDIEIVKPKKEAADRHEYRCYACNRFITAAQFYTTKQACDNCA